MELILYTSNSTGVASNCLYPNRAVITDSAGLVAAGKFDQVFAKYKDNYRSIENFLESYVIPQDVDNESDDPNDWKTVEDLEEEFADVDHVIIPSRHNMLPKGNKSARPRHHILFPCQKYDDPAMYTAVKNALQKKYPFFDQKAQDAARFFYSKSGTAKEVLIGLLDGTGFNAGSEALAREVTYSSQNSGTVRAVLFDFAGTLGYEVVFHRYSVSLVPHRGESKDTKILNGNVLEINKTINVTQNTASYSLKVKPKCPIGVGDEVHLVFDRLGIDDRVRVLGIKSEPFISENLTLEVGAYEPDLESDSVQIVTNLLSQEKTYYGTRISADKGLEIHRSDNLASVTFNADTMAFYQGSEEITAKSPSIMWRNTMRPLFPLPSLILYRQNLPAGNRMVVTAE